MQFWQLFAWESIIIVTFYSFQFYIWVQKDWVFCIVIFLCKRVIAMKMKKFKFVVQNYW